MVNADKVRLISITILVAILWFRAGVGIAQNLPDSSSSRVLSPSATLEDARKNRDGLRFEEAINRYDQYLRAIPDDYNGYIERAYCFEKLNRYEEAINDYKLALNQKPGEIDLYRKALIDYLQIENYTQATEMFATMVDIKNKTVHAYQAMATDKIKMGDYDGALKEINTALDYDNTNDYSHFLKGVANDSLGNMQVAVQSYLKAISTMYLSKDYKEAKDRSAYTPYFQNLAIVQRRMGHLEESIKNLNSALSYNATESKLYCERGLTYMQKGDAMNALADFNKAVSLDDKNYYCYYTRGLFFKRQEQYQNAVGDFTNAILFNSTFASAYFERGVCYEKLNKFTEAIEEYKLAKENKYNKSKIEESIKLCREREYEYKKENNNPQIVIAGKSDSLLGSRILVPKDRPLAVVKGTVHDQSMIKSITIDGVEASFQPDAVNPSFTATVPLENKSKVTVQVTDIYFNTSTQTYEIERTENIPPVIRMTSPFVNLDGEIYPENQTINNLYVEGTAEDLSTISAVLVNGKNAQFTKESQQSTFSATISIEKTDSLIVLAKDIYDNTTRKAYYINRVAANETTENPMGRTWVVFIENSDYTNLPSLEGTKKDVITMKSALANYHIHKVIHKVNLSKSDMDRFFSIELRDQVNKGMVQSLIIWFAGHGRFINETGYWLPVDASKIDEYTYFPITSLKGYLSLYKLRHTLVISDACETGPAFYLAMRNAPKPIDCNDWEHTRLKSSQVFTSSDKETSSDNSIFTKTFANVLNNNPGKCIPIEKIAEKVIPAVEQNQKQKPKFGLISGLEDESGTFYFIRK